MPSYNYTASDEKGRITKGTLYASSLEELRSLIEEKGLVLLHAKEEYRHTAGGRFSLLYFTEELAFLLGSGYKIDDALSYLEESAQNQKMREVIKDIKEFVVRGGELYEALKKYHNIFPDYYIALVRAGYEGRATLARIFEKLRDYIKKEKQRKDAIKKALIYPAILITVSIFSLVFLLGWVVPRFIVIFSDLEGTLPLPTIILLNITHFFTQNGLYIALLLIVSIVFYKLWTTTSQSGKETVDWIKLNMPIIKNLILKREISRLSFAIFILLESGLRFQEAMKVSISILSNTLLSQVFTDILSDIERGVSPGAAFSGRPFIPRDVSGIVSLGEKASMARAFGRISERYEEGLNITLERMLALIEPLTLLLLGGFIGFIVISILLAVFKTSTLVIT